MLLLIKLSAFSQKHNSYFLSLQTDNDAYLMSGQDRYYTNGLIITFDKPLHHSSEHTDLLSLQIGHQLFNGKRLYGNSSFNWDRPSTGRFFLNGSFQRVYANEWLWNVKAEIGIVGKAGKGKEIQKFIHKVFAMYEVESWETSLKSALGLDFEANAMKSLWRDHKGHFEVSTGAGARVGMNFTNLSTQVAVRAGKLAHYQNSNFVGNGGFFDKASEYYFFYTPSYKYQFYNASIQGALFARKKEERYGLSKNLFVQQVGFAYSNSRFSIETTVFFNTKEGREMLKNHRFGTIKAGFRF